MTEKQKKDYNEFIDYMVVLYHEFGYLLEDTEGHPDDQQEESVV